MERRRGQTMMYSGRAVQLLAFGSDGITVRYLSSGVMETIPNDAVLTDPTEPDAATRYNTGLTPGRVAQ